MHGNILAQMTQITLPFIKVSEGFYYLQFESEGDCFCLHQLLGQLPLGKCSIWLGCYLGWRGGGFHSGMVLLMNVNFMQLVLLHTHTGHLFTVISPIIYRLVVLSLNRTIDKIVAIDAKHLCVTFSHLITVLSMIMVEVILFLKVQQMLLQFSSMKSQVTTDRKYRGDKTSGAMFTLDASTHIVIRPHTVWVKLIKTHL